MEREWTKEKEIDNWSRDEMGVEQGIEPWKSWKGVDGTRLYCTDCWHRWARCWQPGRCCCSGTGGAGCSSHSRWWTSSQEHSCSRPFSRTEPSSTVHNSTGGIQSRKFEENVKILAIAIQSCIFPLDLPPAINLKIQSLNSGFLPQYSRV